MKTNSFAKKMFQSTIKSTIGFLHKLGGDDLFYDKKDNVFTSDVNVLKKQTQAEIQEDFFMACAKGDLAEVIKKINEGAKINEPRSVHYLNTGLHYACEQGRVDVINALIDRGADINQTNNEDETPGHSAISKNQVEAAKILINNNADLEATNMFGEKFIHLALARKQTEIMDLLIAKNVDLEAKDRYLNTPILIAAKTDDYKNCLKLAEKGVNLNVRGTDGYSPAHLSAMFRLPKNMVALAFSGCNFNCEDNNGDVPGSLYNMVRKRPDADPEHFVLHLNSDCYEIDNNFHMAAKLGMSEVCLGHLKAGRSSMDLDQNGQTVLQCAEESKQLECVEILKNSSFTSNKEDSNNILKNKSETLLNINAIRISSLNSNKNNKNLPNPC